MARRISEKLSNLGLDLKYYLVVSDIVEDGFQAKEIPFLTVDFNHKLPFSNSVFDAIYSIEVFEHIPNPYGLLAECFRLLKPGAVS